MDKNQILESFVLEVRRGTVVLCVLSQLKEARYGYDLIERLERLGVIVEANTLYPLLRRLEGQGLLISEWNTEGAKPRKYYKTTEFCEEIFREFKDYWLKTTKTINDILEDR